jgi:hypothetical protein
MHHFTNDEQRSALNRRLQGNGRQLQALVAQKTSLDQNIYDERYHALLSQRHEVARLLDDLYLDELSVHHMEGSE